MIFFRFPIPALSARGEGVNFPVDKQITVNEPNPGIRTLSQEKTKIVCKPFEKTKWGF